LGFSILGVLRAANFEGFFLFDFGIIWDFSLFFDSTIVSVSNE